MKVRYNRDVTTINKTISRKAITMRKITLEVAKAFSEGRKLKMSNTETDGKTIWLHSNKIAEKIDGSLWINSCGWLTNTTKERLNGLEGVNITQMKGVWYLNGVKWDGNLIKI